MFRDSAFNKMADEEREFTLQFIKDYRNLPVLWDQNNKLYTHKVTRTDALKVLVTKYNMDVDGVKKKIKSLRSYFSKEHHKVNKSKKGAGSDEVYHSSWFAYEHLLFIAYSVSQRESRRILSHELKEEQTDILIGESSVTSHSTCVSEDELECTLPPMRKKRILRSTEQVEAKEDETYNLTINPSEEIWLKDEFTLYGQLIAHKMGNLNPCNQLVAQQRINNVLIDLEMKQMNVTKM